MDKRLGRKGADGSVEVWPEQYPDGREFNRLAEAAPTTLMLDNVHFVVLPIGKGNVTEEARAELLKLTGAVRSVEDFAEAESVFGKPKKNKEADGD